MTKQVQKSREFKGDQIPEVKGRIICPLSWRVAQVADNYSISALSSTRFINDEGEAEQGFVFKSQPLAKRDVYGRIIPPGEHFFVMADGSRRDQYWMRSSRGFDPERMVQYRYPRDGYTRNRDTRGHAIAFYEEVERLRNEGLIAWTKNLYYFLEEEGVKAYQEYLEAVREGKVRTSARSWREQFAANAGITFEELEKKYPQLYGKVKMTDETAERLESRKVEAGRPQRQTQPDDAVRASLEDDVDKETLEEGEPTDQALKEIEREGVTVSGQPLTEEEIAEIAEEEAGAVIEKEQGEIETDAESDLRFRTLAARQLEARAAQAAVPVTRLFLSNYDEPARLSEDTFIRMVDVPGTHRMEDRQFFEVLLPETDKTMFLSPGTYLIDGHKYELVVKGNEDVVKEK